MSYRARRPTLQSNYVTAYFYKDKKVKYAHTRFSDLQIPPSATGSVIDVGENGELATWEVTMDNATAIPLVTLYGDDETQFIANDNSTNDLLTLGRGLCPGDVKLVGGVSPDLKGTPMWNYAYVARYKADLSVDVTGRTAPTFVIRWFGQLPVPYRRFTLNILNTSNTAAVNVLKVYVLRVIYEQLPGAPTIERKGQERRGVEDGSDIIQTGYRPYGGEPAETGAEDEPTPGPGL